MQKCSPDVLRIITSYINDPADLIILFEKCRLDINMKFEFDASRCLLKSYAIKYFCRKFPNMIVTGLFVDCSSDMKILYGGKGKNLDLTRVRRLGFGCEDCLVHKDYRIVCRFNLLKHCVNVKSLLVRNVDVREIGLIGIRLNNVELVNCVNVNLGGLCDLRNVCVKFGVMKGENMFDKCRIRKFVNYGCNFDFSCVYSRFLVYLELCGLEQNMDFGVISGCKRLRTLNVLHYGPILNFEEVSKCEKLKSVNLCCQRLMDTEGLKKCKKLKYLRLREYVGKP